MPIVTDPPGVAPASEIDEEDTDVDAPTAAAEMLALIVGVAVDTESIYAPSTPPVSVMVTVPEFVATMVELPTLTVFVDAVAMSPELRLLTPSDPDAPTAAKEIPLPIPPSI